MKIFKVFLTFFLITTISFSQNKSPFKIYNSKGKKVTYKKMIQKMVKADIVFFGELHNNAISHWLQYETSKELIGKRAVIFGAEMFEADNQVQLNEYLSNNIDKIELDSTARLWKNFKTDYKPLVDIAKNNNLPFIATNVPRRYASMVYKEGFEVLEELPENEKEWIAPLPIKYDPNLPGYQEMLKMMGGHGGENLPKAQAIKDATMAHFILKNYIRDSLFIHFNGTYHSDNYEGIVWYIKQHNPNLNVITINTSEQENINKLEPDNNKANFIIIVDKDMTKTY